MSKKVKGEKVGGSKRPQAESGREWHKSNMIVLNSLDFIGTLLSLAY